MHPSSFYRRVDIVFWLLLVVSSKSRYSVTLRLTEDSLLSPQPTLSAPIQFREEVHEVFKIQYVFSPRWFNLGKL